MCSCGIEWVRSSLCVGVAVVLCIGFVQCKDKPGNPQPSIRTVYYTPAWSPDGREIACALTRIDESSNQTYFTSIVDAQTGEILREQPMDGPAPFNLYWTPDGKWLLFGAPPGIFKMSADLDSSVQLTSGEFLTEPSVSRARNLVFFTKNNGAKGGLFSITLEGDSLKRWSTATTIVLGCSAYSDSSDSLVGFDATQSPFLLVAFTPSSLDHSLYLPGESADPIVRISRDHRYVAYNAGVYPGDGCNLILLDRANDSSQCVTLSPTLGMDFSPDGRRLVYPVQNGKEVGLWILDVSTGKRARLTDGTR